MKTSLLGLSAAVLAVGSMSASAIPMMGDSRNAIQPKVNEQAAALEYGDVNISPDEVDELFTYRDWQRLDEMEPTLDNYNQLEEANPIVWQASTTGKGRRLKSKQNIEAGKNGDNEPKPTEKTTVVNEAKEKKAAEIAKQSAGQSVAQNGATLPRVAPAHHVVINISRKYQTMHVIVNDEPRYAWKVSTGFRNSRSTDTPAGTYTPSEMKKRYFSNSFGVILPYGIRVVGGDFIHAASEGGINYLGIAHSHGCIRLHPANAKKLFALVAEAGMRNTRVVIH